MNPVAIVAIVAISSMGNDVIHHDCHDSPPVSVSPCLRLDWLDRLPWKV